MNTADRTPPSFLTGGGEVGQLMRACDWSNTALGPAEQWPQSLKTAVSIVLRSSYPMFIWWGPDLINIHNDAYVPLMGNKHPAFLGKPANELWSEIWESTLLPMKTRVFNQQESIYGQDLMLLLERKEFAEEGYFNFSYSPIIDESGQVGGLFCACHEDTDKVLLQRRLQTLNELNSAIAPVKKKPQIGQVAINILGANFKDIPFSAFYLVDPDESTLRLINHSGIVAGDRPFPQTVSLSAAGPDDFWLVQTVSQTRQPAVVPDVSQKIARLTQSLSHQLPTRALVLPVQKSGVDKLVGILVAGLSPHREFDTEYRHFLEVASSQIAAAIGNLEAHENEFHRAKLLAEIDQQAQVSIAENRARAEAHVRSIIDQAPVGIAVLQGEEFVFEAVNDNYLMLIGKTPQAAVGRSIFDVLPELRNQGIFELLTRVVQTGKPFVGNEFPVTLNRYGRDETVYFNFIYQPLRESNQAVSGVIVVANDITELVKSKHAIQESERQFRNLVMKSPIAMTIFRGPEYIIEIANETLLRNIWRRSIDEVQGRKLLEVFPELNNQQYPRLLEGVLKTGIAYREKEAIAQVNTRFGMSTYYLDFEYAPLFETDNSVSGIMVTVSDVTEKVEARMAIKEAELQSRMAIEAAEMGTYDWDMEKKAFQHSERLATIFGFPAGQRYQHQDFGDAISPDYQPIRARAHQEAFKTGRLMYEARLARTDHAVQWVRVVGRVVFDQSQKPIRLLGAAMDITQQMEARKNLEEIAEDLDKRVQQRTLELQNTNQELMRTNHELEQFAYIASHDLQEPLRKIQTFAELLQDSIQHDVTTEPLLQKIASSAQRMSTLIRDVLNYSRLSKTDELFVNTDLNQILNNVKTDFELLIEQKEAVISQTDLPVINAIPLQLNQLFYNLIGNSLKFSEQNPHIQISAEFLDPERVRTIPQLLPSQKYLKLRFKDNGIGFEQHYAEQIFTIFHRLNGRKSYSGTGIGLALCKKIVENHQGVILAESVPNQGASFTIYLPV
ncbi:hypothetical protein GCM10027347_21780 [Larkinella harenae]